MPFERARTLLVRGRILRRLKQKREARAAFSEAHELFRAAGAARWTETASAELRRLATRRAPDELTPTERQIAVLAATGLSNPEIAARVYVSRKTVEANLARVYRKLGISSRAQLGRALAGTRSRFRRELPLSAAPAQAYRRLRCRQDPRASSPSATGRTSTTPTSSSSTGASTGRSRARTRTPGSVPRLHPAARGRGRPLPVRGNRRTVRDVAERARIPFERILAAALAPWPHSNEGGPE